MSRRASLPGASELFRRTSGSSPRDTTGGRSGAHGAQDGADPRCEGDPSCRPEPAGQLARAAESRRGSGRRKHDAKITVYVSGEELLAMEQARLTLRGSHDLVVDRGRIVREAVAVLLADFEENGEDSVLVRRLRGEESRGDGERAQGRGEGSAHA